MKNNIPEQLTRSYRPVMIILRALLWAAAAFMVATITENLWHAMITSYHRTQPITRYYLWHDVTSSGTVVRGQLLMRSQRTVRRTGVYLTDTELECLIRNEWVTVQSLTARRNITRATGPSTQFWLLPVDRRIPGPTTCRVQHHITLAIPNTTVVKTQSLMGEEFEVVE